MNVLTPMLISAGPDYSGIGIGSGSGIGAYSAGSGYSVGDIVNYNGELYRAIQAGSGNDPSTSPSFWSLYNELLSMTTAADPAINAATTSSIVNSYSGTIITLTGPGNAQTIGDPTDPAPGKRFTVVNHSTSTDTIEVNGIVLEASHAQSWMWSGATWTLATSTDADQITFNPATYYGAEVELQAVIDTFAPTASGINEASRALVSDALLDLNFSGGYLLNDQTTTNMMSKGPAYRFDVGDYITANGIATHTNCDGAGLGVWFRYHNTGANQRLLYWGDDNANETLGLSIAADDDKISGTFKLAATDQWSFDTPALTDGAEYFMYFTHNGTEPLIYLNGVLQTLTYSITFDKTKWLGDTNAIDTFVWGGIDYNSAGINATFNSEISHGIAFNTLLTASEVKDLSANTPFKWIGASQTTKVTNGDFGADSDWTEGGDTAIGAGVAVITTSAVPTRGTLYQDAPSNFVAGKEYSVSLDIDAISNNLYFQVRDAGGTEQVSASQTYTTMGTKTFNFIALVSSSTAGAHFQVDNTAAHTATVDNVVITQIGVVADYPSHGISDAGWKDVSGNANDGVNNGATVQHYKGFHSDGTDLFADGDFTSAGNLVIGTAGKGIDFNPAGTGAAANLLDDYEEGTWTPTLSDGTHADATYTVRTGTYTKVGNKVHVQGKIVTSALGTIVGSLKLIGLPFTTSAIAGNYSALNFGYGVSLAITAGTSPTGFINIGSTEVLLYVWDTALGVTALQETEFTANGNFTFSGEYIV